MTLPKGFGSGGGGASRADVEGMIGKRIENYTSLITLSYLGAFFATTFGPYIPSTKIAPIVIAIIFLSTILITNY